MIGAWFQLRALWYADGVDRMLWALSLKEELDRQRETFTDDRTPTFVMSVRP